MSAFLRAAGAAILLCASATAFAQSLGWNRLSGSANDIGVGPKGDVWVIGTDSEAQGDYGIHRYTGSGWQKIPGGAVRIDVGPNGPWVVNAGGGIYRYNGNGWDHMPGGGKDIGIGANGTVWLIGAGAEHGGYGIFRFNGSNWDKIAGAAVRIDVDPNGNAWVVTSGNAIFRYDGSKFVQVPGGAIDIGIGANGVVYIAGTDGGVHAWNGSNWDRKDGNLAHVSVDGQGKPYGVNASRQIWAASAGQSPVARPTICETPRCGVPDAGGIAGDFNYNCGTIPNATIRAQCEAYNAAIPAAKNACGGPGNKGWLVCVRNKLPKIPSTLPWTRVSVEQCYKRNRVAASCKDAFPWWMLIASGGQGQLQSCQAAYQGSGSDDCLQASRLIELCGDWSAGVTGASGDLYHSPWSREACLAEARKK